MGKEKRSKHLLQSSLAFLVLLTTADIWANHHFGFGIENPGVFAIITSGAAGAMAVLSMLLGKYELKVIRHCMRGVFRIVLSFRVLAICYFVFIIAVMSFSTVRVTFDQEISDVRAVLIPANNKSQEYSGQETARGMMRFIVPANPFGRVFYLKVDGYMPETLTVHSPRGLSINVDKDLRVKPVVLLRPTLMGLRELEDGGQIVISLAENSTLPGGDIVFKKYRGSFLLGKHRWIPSERFERWRMDLQMMDPGKTNHAKTLLEWSRPKILAPEWELVPGLRLLVNIETVQGDVNEKIEFTVGDERFIDVLLARQ